MSGLEPWLGPALWGGRCVSPLHSSQGIQAQAESRMASQELSAWGAALIAGSDPR